jgi:diketogulonate reductase-like aldo/keto reductase
VHWPLAFKSGEKLFPLNEEGVFQLADIDPAETYKTMEKLLETGKARAIGVSNFNQRRLEDLLSKVTIVPAANQIEAHPYLQQQSLKEFCEARGILIEAYSPLGNNLTGEPRTVDDPLVKSLAKDLGMDGGQLLGSWGVQRGTVVLPKSVTPSRIETNHKIQQLPTKVYEQLNQLERHKRFNFPIRWGFDIFEEAGEKVKRAVIETATENKRTREPLLHR